jgi:uncharacterized lipoprotein YajG
MSEACSPNVRQTCVQINPVYSRDMTKLCLLLLLAAALIGGCATEPSGSREFIPGKGWEPTE